MKRYNVTVNDAGDVFWNNEAGKLHREGGPAAEGQDGYRAWYIDGKIHREDGPAIECSDGGRM